MVKENYSNYQKKYDLPKYEELDREFEIGKIDVKSGFYFKDVARTMMNKLGYFAGLLEPAINPPVPTIHSMVEANNIEKEDKEKILKMYKRLLYLGHLEHSHEVAGDERIFAGLVKELWKEWPSLKREMGECMKIILESWIIEKKEEISNRYTG